jgi:hypothetical protein
MKPAGAAIDIKGVASTAGAECVAKAAATESV